MRLSSLNENVKSKNTPHPIWNAECFMFLPY